jgi:hypothetical protein
MRQRKGRNWRTRGGLRIAFADHKVGTERIGTCLSAKLSHSRSPALDDGFASLVTDTTVSTCSSSDTSFSHLHSAHSRTPVNKV